MLLVGIAAMSVCGGARAHPHVFIDDAMTLIFDDRGIAGLRLSWTFDAMYSSLLRADNVKGGLGSELSAADIESLREHAFANLAGYNYFLELSINGEQVKVAQVTGFEASFADDKLTYRFTVPLATAEPREVNDVEIAVFDRDYYVAFNLAEALPVTLAHGEAYAAACTVRRDVERQSGIGPVQGDIVKCTYRRKD